MFPPIQTVMLKRHGSYEEMDGTFAKLFEWVEANNVPIGRTIGVYWDNPEFVEPEMLRSAAAVEVSERFQLGDRGDLRLVLEEIPGGKYATTRHVGPYESLEPVWAKMTRQVEGDLGLQIPGHLPAFEVYVNDPDTTPASQLVTELFMPVA